MYIIPAHFPYFLRFVLNIPLGARRKAQVHSRMIFNPLSRIKDNKRSHKTEALFLHTKQLVYYVKYTT